MSFLSPDMRDPSNLDTIELQPETIIEAGKEEEIKKDDLGASYVFWDKKFAM